MVPRRRFLVASSLAVGGGSGCLGNLPGGETTDTGSPTSGADTESSATTTSPTDSGSQVQITASNDDEEINLVTGDDVETVGEIERSRQSGYQLPVTLTDDGAEAFTSGLEQIGAFDDPSAHEIRTYLDGERITTATLGQELAAEIEAGEWDGRLLIHLSNRAELERLRDALISA